MKKAEYNEMMNKWEVVTRNDNTNVRADQLEARSKADEVYNDTKSSVYGIMMAQAKDFGKKNRADDYNTWIEGQMKHATSISRKQAFEAKVDYVVNSSEYQRYVGTA